MDMIWEVEVRKKPMSGLWERRSGEERIIRCEMVETSFFFFFEGFLVYSSGYGCLVVDTII